jgi:hypothetical protein
LSKDPIKERGGVNIYAAGLNSFVNHVDMFGLALPAAAAIPAIAGGVVAACGFAMDLFDDNCTEAEISPPTNFQVSCTITCWDPVAGGSYEQQGTGERMGRMICKDFLWIFEVAEFHDFVGEGSGCNAQCVEGRGDPYGPTTYGNEPTDGNG